VPKATIAFEKHVDKYAVYSIHLDGKAVAHVYGPMAAIVTEAACRYLDTDAGDIKVGDFIERVEMLEDRDESENRNL
jgi:hypothetical protein